MERRGFLGALAALLLPVAASAAWPVRRSGMIPVPYREGEPVDVWISKKPSTQGIRISTTDGRPGRLVPIEVDGIAYGYRVEGLTTPRSLSQPGAT